MPIDDMKQKAAFSGGFFVAVKSRSIFKYATEHGPDAYEGKHNTSGHG